MATYFRPTWSEAMAMDLPLLESLMEIATPLNDGAAEALKSFLAGISTRKPNP